MAYQGGIVVEGGDGALSLPSKIPLQQVHQADTYNKAK
jgi:hypothetical protein